MLSTLVVVLILVASVVVLLYQGAALGLAAQMESLGPGAAPPPDPPRVAVVIAARNEEVDLPATLDGLIGQTYAPAEIVVVDGGSTDRTREVIDARAPRVRRIDEPPLPPGWVGKNWGCATGAQATTSEWLLFLDADVRLEPGALAALMDRTRATGSDLLTVAPKVEMVGFWERVVLPFMVQLILLYFRAPRMSRPNSRAALVNGQCYLIRRSVYESVGGHRAIRGYVLEDIALARNLKAAGARMRVVWAPELATTRMYRDRHEMFEGLLKNIHGLRYSAARQAGFLAGVVGFYYLPLLVLPLGLLAGNLPLIGMGGFLWVALFGKHVGFARAVGAPAAYGLLYPLSAGFYVALLTASLVDGSRGRPIRWKGRLYDRAAGPASDRSPPPSTNR
ncbi:MAG: glycosyltransferase family 2 protein [Thermoplasmata archaeon]